jgi:hypothetical protein
MAGKHPKYVYEPLGHASTSIILDIYSHIIESMDVDSPTPWTMRCERATWALLLPSGYPA